MSLGVSARTEQVLVSALCFTRGSSASGVIALVSIVIWTSAHEHVVPCSPHWLQAENLPASLLPPGCSYLLRSFKVARLRVSSSDGAPRGADEMFPLLGLQKQSGARWERGSTGALAGPFPASGWWWGSPGLCTTVSLPVMCQG